MKIFTLFFIFALLLSGCGSSKINDDKKNISDSNISEQNVKSSTNGATIKVKK